MSAAPDGRTLFVWRGLNVDDDTARLTSVIADVCAAEIFDMNGSLVWFDQGQAVPVTPQILRELISKRIASTRLVNRGKFGLAVEHFSFGFAPEANVRKEPNEPVLLSMLNNLPALVARGPSQPQRLTAQREWEIRERLKTREPAADVAAYYGIPIDEVKRLGQY